MKKKMSFAFAMMLVLMLAGSLALAAGWMFSPRYDAVQLADNALKQQFGITEDMHSFFRRVAEEKDGGMQVTYEGLPFFHGVLGKYTVMICDGKAEASWSLDDQAEAWNAEKMSKALELCRQDGGFDKAIEMAMADAQSMGIFAEQETDSIPTEEEWALIQEKQEAEAKEAKELSAFSADEMDQMAREAIQKRFGLSNQQLAKLDYVEESCWWHMENGQAFYSLYYGLNQKEEWSSGDGIYIVEVNVQTGAVDEIVYDNGLLGNG